MYLHQKRILTATISIISALTNLAKMTTENIKKRVTAFQLTEEKG